MKLLSIVSLFTGLGLAYYVFKHGNLIKTFFNALYPKLAEVLGNIKAPKNVLKPVWCR